MDDPLIGLDEKISSELFPLLIKHLKKSGIIVICTRDTIGTKYLKDAKYIDAEEISKVI